MANEAFKVYAKARKVKLYQVAEALGMRPAEFSVQYMRHELTEPEETKLLAVVDELAQKEVAR